MIDHDLRGVAATAKLAGHPIHPMLIPFPIALLAATLASDLAYWGTGDAFWGQASFWLLSAAMIMSAAAAAAGFADFLGNARIRSISAAWQHMIANLIAVGLALANLILRWTSGATESVLPWGILLSTLVVLILLFSGWKGGTLVYHHRVGMHQEEASNTGPAEPPR